MKSVSHFSIPSSLSSLAAVAVSLLVVGLPSAAQPSICVLPGDVFQEETLGLAEVDLGLVTIFEAILPTGEAVPLNVVDCSGDGNLDVFVPWSESGRKAYATIQVSTSFCEGKAPQTVVVNLRHGNSCGLHGLDESGALVASASAADHSFPQSLVLSSPSGIRTVRIVGSEICILKVCIQCECNLQGDCVKPSDLFTQAVQVPEVDLGWVTFYPTIQATGDPDLLTIQDCSQQGGLGVFIPSSESTAKRNARIDLSEAICCGSAPEVVNILLQHGNSCTLLAYDDAGNLVDSTRVPQGPPARLVKLESPTGIRAIDLIGAEICVLEICWLCQLPEAPTPTPSPQPILLADPIWVDIRNTAGIEDGSELHPFNSIGEAMVAAITQTIQVRAGIYHENVILKDGVKLLGEGFANTVIEGGPVGSGLKAGPGIGAGVSCTGVGPESLLAGFTITGASVGIHCQSSSLSIRENYITDIAPGSLGGDGIRLEDSSPLIQNNVICHVGGMGIRAQGFSEPRIINNTFYDYGYYAGISFAALNIGAVTPIIKNNIVDRGNEEPVGGILWKVPASPILSYNDVFNPANVTGGGSYYAEHDGVSWNEMPGGDGAIVEDPLFLDPANCALDLDPLSACIDAGDPDPAYNDTDGSRNDMGAFGGQRLDVGSLGHPGSGFLFTSVGKIVVTEIDQNPASDTFGLAEVSDTAAAEYYIPKYTDAPFSGYLWIRGLFGLGDDVDYYQLIATPEVGTGSFTLSDPLTKTKYEIHPGGVVTYTHIRLGPNTIDGVPDLYELNKTGYWSQQDLRIIWNTTGLNGRYRLDYKAFRKTGDTTVEQVVLPPNTQDHLTLWLDAASLSVQINDVLYADHTAIEECENIVFPHSGSSELIFNITANHPGGFLRYLLLDCFWGHDNYGGRFTYDQYVGSHDVPPPLWEGPLSVELPPLLPLNDAGDPVPWEDCAYRFRLTASARTTDGYGYLKYGTYNVYHSVETVIPKEGETAPAPACVDCRPESETTGSFEGPELNLPGPVEAPSLTASPSPKVSKGMPPVTIWVDDDNLSGVEDGSLAHPYNTIGEGISAASLGDTVRVMPGLYPEALVLANGVNVLGSGAETTTIDAGGAGMGVQCVGIGPETLFAGFRITQAQVGIYCHTSSLSLRENIISGITPGTSADGIRLDSSSPQIRNNVIYDVDGMGIRAQGASEPTIVNNTIFDFRYYAGISFAALNIEPGQPLIKNNIVMRGNTQPVGGILWNATSTPILSYNNVFDPANVTGGGSFYAVHNGGWTEVPGGPGAISADPLFIDPSNGYFYLDALSPCIDAGDPNPIDNDNDGSRNDIGAFGGLRLEPGASSHSESGFVFTGIGKVPITEIVSDPGDLSHGLLRVSETVANDLHIHRFTDAPLGGALWFHGLFGATDEVDYYQIVAAPYGTSATETLDDPLAKTKFTINPDGTVSSAHIVMGPLSIGGVDNLYLLNKEGYWSFTDLRFIWNTTGLTGKYTVSYKAYRIVGGGSVEEVLLPRNELDLFTILINNDPVQTEIEEITYADHTPINECEKIVLPHDGDSSLIFTITAFHSAGFLKNYVLNCYWGNNRYGGLFTADQYEGSHDSPPPLWQGVLHQELPPLLPRAADESVMDWYTCAYHFHLEGTARITDGIHYLKWSTDNIYQSVDAGTGTIPLTPSPTPSWTPVATPTPTLPLPTLTPTPTNTPEEGSEDFAYMLPFYPVTSPFVLIEPVLSEDISGHGIEMTQGIQCFNTGAGLAACPDNSLDLVIGKDTTARIYLKYSHTLGVAQRDNVPVRLYLRWNAGPWVSVLGVGRAKAVLDQSNAINSININFQVVSGLAAGVLDFYVEVDPNDDISESNEDNNRYPSVGVLSVDFVRRDELTIVGNRLRYHPPGYAGAQYAGGVPVNWTVAGGGASWFNQVLPVRNSGIDYSLSSSYLDWTDSIASGDGQHELISYLNSAWVLANIFSLLFTGHMTDVDHIYGWTPNDGFSGGHADMPAYPHAGGLGVVAIGTDANGVSIDNPGPGAVIFGHELSHDYDVFHTDTGADDCGANDANSDFPYATSSIQEFGYNPSSGKVYNPSNTHDLMSYCPAQGSKEGWISPFTWTKMSKSLSVKKTSSKILEPEEIALHNVMYKTNGDQSLVVNARIHNPEYENGQILGSLQELYKVPTGSVLTLPEGEYAVELREGSEVLSRHSFRVSFKSQTDTEPDLPFMDPSFVIPWNSRARSVVLLFEEDILDERLLTTNSPTVTITDPMTAVTWPASTTQTLEWQGSDLDGDLLSYSVFRSRNSGASWQLLESELAETSLALAVDSLAGGTDTRFRVVATDGLNIGFDETDAPTSVPTKDPMAVISEPMEGSRFSPGGLVLLQGSGTDLEDGSVPEGQLFWSSNVQGLLGTGGTLPVTDLLPGPHLITLTVIDSEGQVGEATVLIAINSEEIYALDQNQDGWIDQEDLLEILSHWAESMEQGYPPTKADINQDGGVDQNDLFDFGRYYKADQW